MLGFHIAGEGDITPTPKRFQTKFISKCNNISATKASRASEATRSNPRGTKFTFPGGTYPQIPQGAVSFPLPNKTDTLIHTCTYTFSGFLFQDTIL